MCFFFLVCAVFVLCVSPAHAWIRKGSVPHHGVEPIGIGLHRNYIVQNDDSDHFISYFFCVVWSVAEPEVARGRDHLYIIMIFSYWGRSQIRRFREWKWLENRRPTLHLCEESIQRSTSPSLPIEPSISRVTHALKSKARNATRSPMAHSKVGSVNVSATHLTFSFT